MNEGMLQELGVVWGQIDAIDAQIRARMLPARRPAEAPESA